MNQPQFLDALITDEYCYGESIFLRITFLLKFWIQRISFSISRPPLWTLERIICSAINMEYWENGCFHAFPRTLAQSETKTTSYRPRICLENTSSLMITIMLDSPLSRGLSTQAKEFKAATRIMQSSSNELSTLVYGKV